MADEPPSPAVIVAVSQELQAAVVVTLVAATLVPRERRWIHPEPGHRVAEGVPVIAICVALVPVQQAPAVALGVGQVEHAGVAARYPVRLADARRERAVAVRQHGRGRGNAISHVRVGARWIALGQPHPQACVAVGIAVAVRERLARQPVLVVPPEPRGLPVQRLRRQVVVQVVALALVDSAGQLVVRVVGELLRQGAIDGLRQPVAVEVVGVAERVGAPVSLRLMG